MSKSVLIFYKGFATLEGHQRPNAPYPIEVLRTTDSVAGLLYDGMNHRVLLVRQRRVAMEREDNPDGLVTELVAGRFDVNLGPKALLVKEAREEAGVTITEDDVVLLNGGKPLAVSAGIMTERCYLAFVEISPEMIEKGDEHRGLAAEGEDITRIWVDADLFMDGPHDCVRTLTMAMYMQQKLYRTAYHALRTTDT